MAPSHSAKRPRLEPPRRGDDDYVPGNIVEIELRNFMTYDRLVCRPGPRLNLVVGPNGSGKSSLAADPAVLARATSVKAFVKRGEDSGHVRLSLRGDAPGGRDIRITRKIDTNNKSEWLLDGPHTDGKCSVRLKQMESKNSKLLQALERFGADKISEAYYWVQDNKNMFMREVYGPVLLEVNLQNKTHASYLENHVPKHIWKSFITQDDSDRDLLFRQLKRYGIPILNYTGGNSIRCEPFNITMEMQQLGIKS